MRLSLAVVVLVVGCGGVSGGVDAGGGNGGNSGANGGNSGGNGGSNGGGGGDMAAAPIDCGALSQCSSACVDLTIDPLHCGTCLTRCGMGQMCVGGLCQSAFDCRQTPCSGMTYCDLNSGTCLPGCASNSQCDTAGGETCDLGQHQCTCGAGLTKCGGQCTMCPTGTNVTATGCQGTQCVATACKTNYQLCNNQCVYIFDPKHCGNCTNDCVAWRMGAGLTQFAYCVSGLCGISVNNDSGTPKACSDVCAGLAVPAGGSISCRSAAVAMSFFDDKTCTGNGVGCQEYGPGCVATVAACGDVPPATTAACTPTGTPSTHCFCGP